MKRINSSYLSRPDDIKEALCGHLATIFGIAFMAAITSAATSWIMSLYNKYPIIDSLVVMHWQLCLVSFATFIMVLYTLFAWCTRKGVNGFKKQFWSTVLSFTLTAGSVTYMVIAVYAKYKCLHFFERGNCPWMKLGVYQYIISSAFLVVQFLFLNFTSLDTFKYLRRSSLKYFCRYFTLSLLMITNYSIWLCYTLLEFREYIYHQSNDIPSLLPCNLTIPVNATADQSSCVRVAEPYHLHKIREKAAIFLFGCVLENCLLSTSNLWYKFTSKSDNEGDDMENDTNQIDDYLCDYDDTINENGIEDSFNLSDSVNVNEYNRESDISTIRGHSKRKCSFTKLAISLAIVTNIAYVIFVIVLRMEVIKLDISIFYFHLISTLVQLLFSFIPNLTALIILCKQIRPLSGYTEIDSSKPESVHKPHFNKLILFFAAFASCVYSLCNVVAGFHALEMCSKYPSFFLDKVCNTRDIILLIIHNVYVCFAFLLQLFVLLNFKYFENGSNYALIFRKCTTIVAISSITFWTVDSFVLNFQEEQLIQIEVFGKGHWFLIMHVVYPCFTFYRIYCFEICIEFSCFYAPFILWRYICRRCELMKRSCFRKN